MINRNMGCIEMMLRLYVQKHPTRLIETWDVLKFVHITGVRRTVGRLIETWDVLK